MFSDSFPGFFRYKWPTDEGQSESIAERLQKCDELKEALKVFFDDYILEVRNLEQLQGKALESGPLIWSTVGGGGTIWGVRFQFQILSFVNACFFRWVGICPCSLRN